MSRVRPGCCREVSGRPSDVPRTHDRTPPSHRFWTVAAGNADGPPVQVVTCSDGPEALMVVLGRAGWSYFLTVILTLLVTALKVALPAYFTVTVVVLVSFASFNATLPFTTFLVTFLPL